MSSRVRLDPLPPDLDAAVASWNVDQLDGVVRVALAAAVTWRRTRDCGSLREVASAVLAAAETYARSGEWCEDDLRPLAELPAGRAEGGMN